jgi:hypothetical protein
VGNVPHANDPGQSRRQKPRAHPWHKKGRQYLVTAENGRWCIMPAPKVKIPIREMEGVVADTWNKLGPAPEIDYDKI